MTKLEQVRRLLDAGLSTADIIKATGFRARDVYTLAWCVRNPEKYKARYIRSGARFRAKERAARIAAGRPSRDEIIAEAEKRNAPIIAAVDAGYSYSEVARQFGLKSRNCVAGVMSRRPEARARA